MNRLSGKVAIVTGGGPQSGGQFDRCWTWTNSGSRSFTINYQADTRDIRNASVWLWNC
jgi:hypothetical protein